MLAQVEKQRQPERDTDRQTGSNRSPEVPHAGTAPLNRHEHPEHHRRHDDIEAEEAPDPIGEKLLEERAEVEAMFLEEWDELRIRQEGSRDAECEIQVF